MNIALGQSALLLALLGAVAGAVTLLVGVGTGRPSLLRAGQTYIWLVVAGAVLATVAMQRALITHDFTLVYVDNNDSTFTPLLYRVTAMWSDLAGSILLWALILSGYLAAMWIRFRRRRDEPFVVWAKIVGYIMAAFFFGLMLTASNPFARVHGAVPNQGPARPPVAGPGAGCLPPASSVPRPGGLHCAVLPGRGQPGHGPDGDFLASRGPPLGHIRMGLLDRRRRAGRVVELPGPRMGGLLVLGPGRELSPVALADGHRLLALGHGPAKAGHAAGLEPLAPPGDLQPHHPRDFLHPLRGARVRALVHRRRGVGPALLVFFGLVVATSVGLLAWRGDELHSRGSIETPVSREGAFLANNLLFAVFAFVVLLGTVFPLFVEAVNGSSITVGGPFFDTMTLPLVLCLLFLMAVAPVLPWRRASGELLLQRLLWPALAAVAVLVTCVAAGLRGLWPLIVFTLAAFAGASAVRQLVLLVRRSGLRGFTGRSGGGMVVHLGVVLIAVAFAASHAYEHQGQLTLTPGKPASFQGQTIVFRGVKTVNAPGRTSLVATVDLDGHPYYPAVEQFALTNDAVPSPAVRSTPTEDVYLTLASVPSAGKAPAAIGVIVEPLVLWLWVGGFVIVVGAFLSLWPSRRDRHALLGEGRDVVGARQGSLLPVGEEPAEAGVGAPI